MKHYRMKNTDRGFILSCLSHWFNLSSKDKWKMVKVVESKEMYHCSLTGGFVAWSK